ncbi:MAG TPA: hypothetical protein VJH24_06185 [Candidatus Bilamarchaeaceae archaeon]|nr:hypothetical protein [Candidatus Bilamarchaeaceae archaeon]
MRWIWALVMATVAFGAFAEPPHASVEGHNLNVVGTTLSSTYAASLGEQYPGTVLDPFFYADGEALTMMPSVDRRISAEEDNRLVWVLAASYLQGRVVGETEERPCPDQIVLEFLDGGMDGSIAFTFRDVIESVPLDETTPFLIDVPDTLPLSESNGSEVLYVNLAGTVSATYDYILYPNNPSGEGGACEWGTRQRIEEFVVSKAFEDYSSYTVEAGEPAFFMVRPLLNEQWFRNNRFDSMVFSRKQFYLGEMGLDGTFIEEVRFREFDVSTDTYGVEHVIALPLNATHGANHSQGTYSPPLLGEENHGFLHTFNFTYEGKGWHNLTLRLYDDFNGEYVFQEEILSRALSADNRTTEEGLPINESARPSLPYEAPSATLPVVVLGGAFLLLFLLKFRPR